MLMKTDTDEIVSADDVFVDGQPVIPLVNTGADSSTKSRELALHLKKVEALWTGRHIRTAGDHLLMPTGRCTARVSIRDSSSVATFTIVPVFHKDLFHGFLKGIWHHH